MGCRSVLIVVALAGCAPEHVERTEPLVTLVGGQSNAWANPGSFYGAELTGLSFGACAKAYNDEVGQWQPAEPDVGGGDGAGTGQWWGKFAELSVASGQCVRYVGDPEGGKPISYFVPGDGHYEAVLDRVTDSGEQVDAIVWWQGESDTGTTIEAHLDRLEQLRVAWQRDYGQIPIYAFQIADSHELDHRAVRSALLLWSVHEEVTLIDLDDLTETDAYDGQHYNYPGGYEIAGQRLYNEVYP